MDIHYVENSTEISEGHAMTRWWWRGSWISTQIDLKHGREEKKGHQTY